MPWYDPDWLYRKKLTVTAAKVAGSGTLTGLPVLFVMGEDADIAADARQDGRDILFTSADGTTKLPHELLPSYQFVTRRGGRSWFTHPEAIYYDSGAGVERAWFGYQQDQVTGQPGIAQWDYVNRTLTRTIVGTTGNGNDDHGNPSIIRRSSDGKLICVYPKNHSADDIGLIVSTNANDSTAWGSETALDPAGTGTYAYPSLIELTGRSELWLFARATGADNWGYAVSSNSGTPSFGSWVRLDTDGGGWASNPYFHIASDGDSRIDFLASISTPNIHDDNYKIVHFYFDDGTWRKSDGTDIGTPTFDVSDITTIYDGGATNACWIGDIEYMANGQPHVFFIVYPSETDTNHDLYYSQLSSGAWTSPVKVTDLGGSYASSAQVYHSQPILDPDDDTVAYIPVEVSGVYEIQRWTRSGTTWTFSEHVTTGSASGAHNIRPIVTRGCPAGKAGRLSWVKTRTYVSFDDWSGGIATFPPLGGWQAYVLADVDGATDTDLYCYYGNAAASAQEDAAATWAAYEFVYHPTEAFGAKPGILRDSTGNFGTVDNWMRDDTLATVAGELFKFPPTAVAGGRWAVNGSPNFAGWTAYTLECWAQSSYGAGHQERFIVAGYSSSNADVGHIVLSAGAGNIYGIHTKEANTIVGNTTFSTVGATANTLQYHVMGWSAAGGMVCRVNTTEGSIAGTTGGALDATATSTVRFGGDTSGNELTGYGGEIRVVSNALRSKDFTDTQYQNWTDGNDFFTVGAEEEAPTGFTATAALTVAAATLSGSATFTLPVYSGTAALTVSAATISASGATTGPTYTATGAFTVSTATIAGSATFRPKHTATAALTTMSATLAGSAQFTAPVYTASAALSVTPATFAGTGIFATAVYSGNAALTVSAATFTASGTVENLFTATAALTVSTAVASGSATFAAPAYTASASITVATVTLAGSASFSIGTRTATAALVISSVLFVGTATFEGTAVILGPYSVDKVDLFLPGPEVTQGVPDAV